MRTKHQAIFEDFVAKKYPKKFKKEFQLIQLIKETNTRYGDIEYIVEDTLNKILGIKESDGVYTDAVSKCGKYYFEWKTATVKDSLDSTSKFSHKMTINNCTSWAGVVKRGVMGVVVYNKPKDCVDYFVIPENDIESLLNSGGKDSKVKKIVGSFNTRLDRYANKLSKYYFNNPDDFISALKAKIA